MTADVVSGLKITQPMRAILGYTSTWNKMNTPKYVHSYYAYRDC